MSNKEAIKRISERMLKGWKLLSSCCPVCHNALLSLKDEKYCASCDAQLLTEKDMKEKNIKPVEKVEQKPASALSKALLDEVNEDFNDEVDVPLSYDQLREEFERTREAREAVSNALGAGMLKGHALLSEECSAEGCRGSPLLKDPSNGVKYCVACGFSSDKPVEAPVTTSLTSTTTSSSSSSSFKSSFLDDAPYLPPKKSEKDPSSLISTRLLQGQALLDKCCLSDDCNGGTPLMREKDGKLVCVLCGYVDPVTLTPLQPAATQPSTQPAAQSATSITTSNYEDLSDDSDDDSVAKKIQLMMRGSNLESSEAQPAKAVAPAAPSIPVAPCKRTSDDLSNAASIALNAIKTKIIHTSTSLSQSEVVSDSIQYSLLLRNLAEAAKALKDL